MDAFVSNLLKLERLGTGHMYIACTVNKISFAKRGSYVTITGTLPHLSQEDEWSWYYSDRQSQSARK